MLVNGLDLGGIFLEYPSNVGRNESNELSTTDKDSNSQASIKIATALEWRLNRCKENS